MEIEIIRKLKKEAEGMDAHLSAMPEGTPYERITKAVYAARVDGFCSAVDRIEDMFNSRMDEMAEDYEGIDAK